MCPHVQRECPCGLGHGTTQLSQVSRCLDRETHVAGRETPLEQSRGPVPGLCFQLGQTRTTAMNTNGPHLHVSFQAHLVPHESPPQTSRSSFPVLGSPPTSLFPLPHMPSPARRAHCEQTRSVRAPSPVLRHSTSDQDGRQNRLRGWALPSLTPGRHRRQTGPAWCYRSGHASGFSTHTKEGPKTHRRGFPRC